MSDDEYETMSNTSMKVRPSSQRNQQSHLSLLHDQATKKYKDKHVENKLFQGDEAFAKRKQGVQKNELNEQLKDYINQWRDERSALSHGL